MKDFDGTMRLNQLKMFAAVADHGSFSTAAAKLGCTQSRISHAIAQLERDLGVLLLLRSRAGSAPTEAGARVLAQARQMLQLDANLERVAQGGDALAGRVGIACFRSIGTHLLPHALEALAAAYPGIAVDVDDGCEERREVSGALVDGRADLGIAQLPLETGLASLPYLHDDYMLVLPAALRLEAGNGWPALGALPFIRLRCTGADAILERCRAAGFVPEPGRTLANDTSIAAMVARGMGYSILPRLATFPEPQGVRVLPLPLPASARREFVIAGRRERINEPAVQAVTRTLRERAVVQRTPAWRAGIVGWD
jgi:DNA-binding transcriptional LysR family regulator